MNRLGCFMFGVYVGVLVMQVGLALYLRSGDFWGAAAVTGAFGLVAVFVGHVVGEEWQ